MEIQSTILSYHINQESNAEKSNPSHQHDYDMASALLPYSLHSLPTASPYGNTRDGCREAQHLNYVS